MRIRTICLMLIVIILSMFTVHAEEIPERAVCTVCAVVGTHEAEPEKVVAWSKYQDEIYYFCSEGCKTKFDAGPEGYLPPVLPRPAPEFKVKNLDGKEVTLKTYKDKVVLIDFWATWCKPCEKMIPELQKLHKAYTNKETDKEFVVIGISIDEGKDIAKKVQKFKKKKKIAYPILLDVSDEPAWAAFKVKAIPAMFLIDPKGEIVAQWTGQIEYEKVEAKVNEILMVE